MADSKFMDMPIKMTDKHDAVLFLKASQRYKTLLKEFGLPKGQPEVKRIPANEILPSPFNRLGRPLNVVYIQMDLVPGIREKGYQTSRPVPGVAVKRTDKARLQRLHDHAKNMCKVMGGLLPPISLNDLVNKECAGGNHLTMALRMYRENFFCTLSKTQCEVKDDDDLMIVSQEGHFYYELDDSIPDDDVKFISELLNSDQNQNQVHGEDHLRAAIEAVCCELITPTNPTIPISTITERITRTSVVKLRPDSIGDVAKYVVAFYPGPYISELGTWYSMNVNPRELTVSARWMSDIAGAFGAKRPLSKLALTLVQYRGLTVLQQSRPNPDVSRSIDLPLINALSSEATKLDEMESFLNSNRERFEKYLVKELGEFLGKANLHLLEEACARLLCMKSLDMGKFKHGVSGSKWELAKAQKLQTAWYKHIMSESTALKDMANKFGLTLDEEADDNEDEAFPVHLRPT